MSSSYTGTSSFPITTVTCTATQQTERTESQSRKARSTYSGIVYHEDGIVIELGLGLHAVRRGGAGEQGHPAEESRQQRPRVRVEQEVQLQSTDC